MDRAEIAQSHGMNGLRSYFFQSAGFFDARNQLRSHKAASEGCKEVVYIPAIQVGYTELYEET
jgi:hypothetical protein